MIPRFNDDGYLPAGIHPATLEELASRFGQESELRQAQMESLRWLVDLARRAGAQRIVVNGRIVTDKLEPNDVDCVLLIGAELQELEQLYTETGQRPATSEHVRELTLRSLKKRINQFKEEIARFEARVRSAALKD